MPDETELRRRLAGRLQRHPGVVGAAVIAHDDLEARYKACGDRPMAQHNATYRGRFVVRRDHYRELDEPDVSVIGVLEGL
jgi:hypothetical protein